MRAASCSILVLSLLMVAVSGRTCRGAESADVVLRGGRVVATAIAGPSGFTAVAMRGDRIVYVGDDRGAGAWIGPSTRVVDLRGMLLLPGLVDAHGHLHHLGRLLREPNLVGTTSVDEVVAGVRAFQRTVPPGAWIHGGGWDQNDWSKTSFPTSRDLSEFTTNPIYLDRVDGHALWINRAAMESAGITRDTPDPPGGRIVRDERGEPTGILIDEATKLVESRGEALRSS